MWIYSLLCVQFEDDVVKLLYSFRVKRWELYYNGNETVHIGDLVTFEQVALTGLSKPTVLDRLDWFFCAIAWVSSTQIHIWSWRNATDCFTVVSASQTENNFRVAGCNVNGVSSQSHTVTWKDEHQCIYNRVLASETLRLLSLHSDQTVTPPPERKRLYWREEVTAAVAICK